MRFTTLVKYAIVLNALERVVLEVFELAALGVIAILLILVSMIIVDAVGVKVYPVFVSLSLGWL